MRCIHPTRSGELSAVEALADGPSPDARLSVRVVMVQSVDGRVTVDGVSGPLSSPADHRVFLANRALADVVIVGAETARREGYGPSRLTPELVAGRRDRGQSPVPPIAIVSRSLDLDPGAPFFTEAAERPIVITTSDSSDDARGRLQRHADLIVVDDPLDVAEVCRVLWERGHRRAVLEGGPATIGTFVDAGCVDELCLSVAPQLVGQGEGLLPSAVAPIGLTLHSILEDEGLVVLRYLTGPRTP